MSAAPGGCPLLARPAPLIGALGTSITFGAELDPVVNLTRAPSKHAWPSKLQSLLRERGFANAKVLNGAARGSGADYASLCFDHVWAESTGKTVAPPLDLAIIEYTWTSNVPMMEALIQMLHSRKIPVLAILYYHAANPARFGHVKNDTTPWANYERAVGGYRAFSNLFRRLGVPAVNNSDVNSRYRYCEPQIMSEEGRCQLPLATRSKRHPSKLAHDFLARLVLDEMLSSCTALSGPLPLYPNGFQATCSVDEHLRGALLPGADLEHWQWEWPKDGRSASWFAKESNVNATVRLPTNLTYGFFSLAVEMSWKNKAAARLSCVPAHCTCLTQEVDAHSNKGYTYTQRTNPVYVTMVPQQTRAGGLTAGHSHVCLVRVEVLTVRKGRFSIRAAILSRPLAGNRSISARALYYL